MAAAAVLLAVILLPSPQQPAEAATTKAAPKPVPVADRQEEKDMLRQFKDLYAKKKAALAQRLQGIELLATKQSEKFVLELKKVIDRDPEQLVRAEAAKVLGKQRFDKTNAVVLASLEKAREKQDQIVSLALLDAVEELGYDRKYFDELSKLFEAETTEARVQQRIVKLFDTAKDKQAFKLLVDNLDEPYPDDIHGADNPPAEYWERRWKNWSVWKTDVAAALKNLTGVEFKEAEFYKRWVRKEGKKLGLDY